ncbi:putative ATPase, AAA family [Bradyrhizobium sp. ORS 278]|uniref:ATP-binding protein n=1 Tax=Bradyrhizobium sp. (strain ORS 278) TaxID=114615 RepID=UPI000150825B|nr:ATP-binding protein [Bradyrhizobium sp. ORS 278]CAL78129.1 putative ATPase, AAA family [Bradyrhizobium sp. ORS 278]
MTVHGHDWVMQNQAYLTAMLARVRQALQLHLQMPAANGAGPGRDALPAPDPAAGAALEILVERFRLTPFERDLLVLCAGVELDSSFAALCREAAGRSNPTFSMALAALPDSHWSAITPSGPLRYWKMIEAGPSDNLVSAPLRIDERILHFLAGVSYTDERLQSATRPHRPSEAGLLAAHRVVADRIVALWTAADTRGDALPAIQLVGEDDAGLTELAAAAFALRGLDMRVIRGHEIPRLSAERELLTRLWQREAALAGSGLLIVLDDSEQDEGERAIAAFVERADVALLLAGREPLRLAGHALPRFDVKKPDRTDQAALWRHALGADEKRDSGEDGTEVDVTLQACIDRLVNQFHLGAAAIVNISAMRARGAEPMTTADVAALWETCRAQARSRLDDLAQRVETSATWDDLVLPPFQKQILRDIVVNVRQRSRVHDLWGFAAKSSRGLGISALFAGPSGTGKTLAAEIMANELRLDLYRIDLSQIVSKYIGETEKNLRRVFDAAETAGAVLLFDEADALFGKRSEVKDSHDRYANIEVSYLLQRMEAYRGLAILTTNMKQALDPAFMRRIRFVVQFPFPDFAERAEIWRRVFPSTTPMAALNVDSLARLNVSGGNIRNIALGAAFVAADEDRPVTMAHLLRAARAEYAKLERPLTDSEIGGWS